ncbi:hypothetical protein MAXJ12_05913 [Mesorhizobium alhagi CCNWXJ12-2]|jgi:hypothetical protein|uniref:Uncharacterized protein n=2 Tax=Allomesorhizobium alhagi TaxID=475067 RepID=H0HM19_9HYPH|nr:hypothetical protein MAXJ12_05913 [Mesorhizobium alhagi CCNWXJ12-2]
MSKPEADMTGNRGKDAELSRTTGADTVHARRKANPDTEDLTDPKEVWKDSETSPSADRRADLATGGSGRVADGGDLDKAQPSPYSTETQADAVAGQTDRKDEPPGTGKPKQ